MAINSITGYGVGLYTGANAAATGAAAPPAATPANADAGAAAKSSGASVNVTLSAEAQAMLAAQADTRSIDAVTTGARGAIDKLLSDAKATSALVDGKPTISLAGLDRRSLYAVANDQDGKFSTQEQVVATLQLQTNSDAALATPAAVTRITGDYTGLYKAALANLDLAGPEEKASDGWTQAKAALTAGLKAATDTPGVAPAGIEGDPVAAYLKRVGGAVANPKTRDIAGVASDVRTVLDKQYAAAATTGDGAAAGEGAGTIDFSQFDDRSLAAVALNTGDQFSAHEVIQAKTETAARNRAAVMSAFNASQGAADGAFGKSLITQYAAMSPEERDAAGWTPAFYDKIVSMQNLSDKLASMFNADGSLNTGGFSLVDYL